jgi:predicted GIY-YIG superfamily endonuclease
MSSFAKVFIRMREHQEKKNGIYFKGIKSFDWTIIDSADDYEEILELEIKYKKTPTKKKKEIYEEFKKKESLRN